MAWYSAPVPRVIQSLEALVNGMYPRGIKRREFRSVNRITSGNIYDEADNEVQIGETGKRDDTPNQILDIEFVPLHVVNIDLDPTMV